MKRSEDGGYREYATARMEALRRTAYLLCHDWHLADDLVAITIGKLYRHWRRAKDVTHLDAYVRRILVRSRLDEKARPWRREEPTDELPETAVAAAVGRLTAVLTTAVQKQLPGTAFEANPGAEYPKGTPHGPFEFFHVNTPLVDYGDGSCGGGEDYFTARATTVTAGVKGNVMALIGRMGGTASPSTECSTGQVAGGDLDCERRTGPNGEVVVITTLSNPSGVTYYRSEVSKADGTGIIVQAENVAVDAKAGGTPESPTPPLSHEQLTQIALDPGVTLYP
ncbi:hypothetical protein [Saccharothrix deserti]|uniref:hypothetical protein n=1 Tax=Saccharothrix deserti TaxID=2593674 RepID=UPI00131D9562|nr:hypothetical protein [Saccharothrix deserti]